MKKKNASLLDLIEFDVFSESTEKAEKKEAWKDIEKEKVKIEKTEDDLLNALESIRKNKISKKHMGATIHMPLSPEELESAYYCSLMEEADQEFFRELVYESIGIILNSRPSLNNFEEILEEYKKNYRPAKKRRKKYTEYARKLINLIGIKKIKGTKINVYFSKEMPLMTSQDFKISFTERNPLLSIIAEKSLRAEKIERKYPESLKILKDSFLDAAVLQSKLINPEAASKEEITEFKRVSRVRGAIKEGKIAPHAIIQYAIPSKVRNGGLIIYIGEPERDVHKAYKNKKLDYITVPVISIAVAEEGKKKPLEVVNEKGEKEFAEVSRVISLHIKMRTKEFMKCPLPEESPVYLVKNEEDLKRAVKKQKESIKYAIRYFEKTKEKELLIKTGREIIQELKLKKQKNQAALIEEIIKKTEKTNVEEIDINNTLKEIAQITKDPKRVRRKFLILAAKQSIESPVKREEKEKKNKLIQTAEAFFKATSGELFLLRMETLAEIMNMTYFSIKRVPPENSRPGLFISQHQGKYLKPVDYAVSQKSFLSLIKYTAKSSNASAERLKRLLEFQLIKANNLRKNGKTLRKINREIIESLNQLTNKKFKNVQEAFEFFFSNRFKGNIDMKKAYLLEKKASFELTKVVINSIINLSKMDPERLLIQNELYGLYKRFPGIVEKIIDLKRYIYNKEEAFSKAAALKTLEKIKKIEEEVNELKSK